MKLTITCTETLETIYTQKDLHPVLQGLLRQITFQERVETNFQTSLRAKNSFSEWVAGLIAINPTASLTNGKKMPLTTLLEHEAGSLKEFKEIQLDLAEADLLAYAKVSNTPGGQPIISVIVYSKFDGETIGQLRIAATGVSKSPYFLADYSKDMAGKSLDANLVKLLSDKYRKEITPANTYMGSADYRKEMAGVLVERILSNKINGEM